MSERELLIAVIAIGAAALFIALLLWIKNRNSTEKYRDQEKRVIVSHGVDIKSQKLSEGKGMFFSGSAAACPTFLAGGRQQFWEIVFTNQATGEMCTARFRERLCIGREAAQNSEAYLRLENSTKISREHCEIFARNGQLFLADLQSKNGTFLNGSRITRETILSAGDTIRIGDVRLKIAYERIM